MNSPEAKHPHHPECQIQNKKIVCRTDMNRHASVVLAVMGSDIQSHSNTEATHKGGERQNTNRGCVIDRDGWMRC